MRIANGIMPNLILLDLRLPLLEGKTCLEKIRSDNHLDMIKIVTVSDRADLSFLEESIGKGANGYIIRPLAPTELYRTIQKTTGGDVRQFPRLRVIFKATIFKDGTGRTTFATMLSEQGAFIRSINPFPEGTKLKLSLDLPAAKPLHMDGEVIYTVKYNPKDVFYEPGMGIKFLNLSNDLRLGLRKFIEGQLGGDLDPELMV